MRHRQIRQIQHIFATLSFLLILAIGIMAGQTLNLLPADLRALVNLESFWPAPPQVALISGHAGHDSGAVCTDASGAVLYTEAGINARVAELAAQRLRRFGYTVTILEEYDERLSGLRSDVLLSLHADSCVELSGYKAAHRLSTPMPDVEGRLLHCIDEHYAAATGLSVHPNTITHNMTGYHAFRRMHPDTPAAILELGFLGGDGALLTQEASRVAEGVAASLRCFLEGEE
jgi:N-acetylmuramoyl-L-alanine amidase